MTYLECLQIPWQYTKHLEYWDVIKVAKNQLETIIDDWLILDDGQFDKQPDGMMLYARKIRLSGIRYFCSFKEIVDDRLLLIGISPNYGYRYLVKENKF